MMKVERSRTQEFSFGKRELFPDVVECKTVDEANALDKTIYRLERFSESRNCYIFVKRSRV